jgi:hypothetical protein
MRDCETSELSSFTERSCACDWTQGERMESSVMEYESESLLAAKKRWKEEDYLTGRRTAKRVTTRQDYYRQMEANNLLRATKQAQRIRQEIEKAKVYSVIRFEGQWWATRNGNRVAGPFADNVSAWEWCERL